MCVVGRERRRSAAEALPLIFVCFAGCVREGAAACLVQHAPSELSNLRNGFLPPPQVAKKHAEIRAK